MQARPNGSDSEGERRRQILRRATLFTYGFFLAAVAVALVGSAIVAWLLSATGLPFLETWIVISAVVLLIPLIGLAIGALRGNERRRGE